MRLRVRGTRPSGDAGQEQQAPPAPAEAPRTVSAAELQAMRAHARAWAAQREAQRDLVRLRTRYWSGERLIEEARAQIEWWEHPEADPHAVLELLPGASIDEAAAARRRIARQCHPDATGGSTRASDLALRRMIAANAAYDRLRRALHPV